MGLEKVLWSMLILVGLRWEMELCFFILLFWIICETHAQYKKGIEFWVLWKYKT